MLMKEFEKNVLYAFLTSEVVSGHTILRYLITVYDSVHAPSKYRSLFIISCMRVCMRVLRVLYACLAIG